MSEVKEGARHYTRQNKCQQLTRDLAEQVTKSTDFKSHLAFASKTGRNTAKKLFLFSWVTAGTVSSNSGSTLS